MMSCCEAAEVFALLEGGGGAGAARAAAAALAGLYGAVREPWLTRGLLAYHARTHSARAVDLLARAPEPHARLLLDHLLELLRGERPARHAALAALAPLAARRPAWLHRLPHHPLPRELLRAARSEREPLPALHALLALAALLPAAPAAAAPLWPDLADALLRPAALEAAAAAARPAAAAAAAHLRHARLALFHALYATHPCTLLDALRAELAAAGAGSGARAAWERELAPLLGSVRLHPGLVTGSRAREADATRWARLELHDVVAESRRLELRTPERGESPPEPAAASAAAAPPEPASPPAGSGFAAARAVAALRPGVEPWFPLSERCGADSAPATPLPAEPDAAEPPEAAVEATPENTPAKETRAQFRFPAESGAVRAIGRRETSPPAADAVASRISRVMAERRAADSPVAFGGAPPAWGAGVARPQPSRPARAPAPPDGEDREVRELTAAPPPAGPPPAGPGASPPPADPRRAGRPGPGRPGRPAAPPRRASSAPPRAAAPACSVAVQTVDCWPEPYEFLVADFYRDMPDNPLKPVDLAESRGAPPCERLDAHLAALYAGAGSSPAPAPAAPATPAGVASRADLVEQLALAHAALMYERWRRDAHAERNRRLLGRCRAARAQELQNAALRDRLLALTRERDELAARLARPAAAAGHPAACEAAAAAAAEREARLEAALRDERLALARASARAADAEAECAAQAAALQRARGETFEAARHAEALARAALAAARRGEQVRRLRRSLAVLGERDARLAALAAAGAGAATGAGGAPAPGEAERALRASWARAEAEAGAQATRAEAASARAAEAEAALALREATLGELKRAARHAAEEHAARLRASQDKYDSLMLVLRAAEARRLERDEWEGDAPDS